MATWNSRGLRGSTLEELVNRTNEQYREKGLALIQKIPTPITPVKMDKDSRHITLAYFDQRSTVDYIGIFSIICLFGNYWFSGSGWKREGVKASVRMSFARNIICL